MRLAPLIKDMIYFKVKGQRCANNLPHDQRFDKGVAPMTKELPSVDLLRKLLRYDPETGKLFWRERCENIEPRQHTRNTFNKQFAGKEAFTANSAGYKIGRIYDVAFKAHRVIMAMHYGEWPTNPVDHINGIVFDNRISNLRAVKPVENARNTKIPSHNTSGVIGVHWYKAYQKWSAHITVGRKTNHLGYFEKKEDAVAARKKAEREIGFHENHGRNGGQVRGVLA